MLRLFGANPGPALVTGIVLVVFRLVAHAYLLAGQAGLWW